MSVVQVYICHNQKDIEFAVDKTNLPEHYSKEKNNFPYYIGKYKDVDGNIKKVSIPAKDEHKNRIWFKNIVDLGDTIDIYALFKMTKENE